MLLQVAVVLAQEHIDPCFFLPRRVSRVQTYNYHPPLPLPDPEAPEQTLGDCAICMEAILVDPSLRRRSKSSDTKERPTIGVGDGIALPFLKKVGGATRKTYSLAPCHHLFVSVICRRRFRGTLTNVYMHVAYGVSGAVACYQGE